jgi:hypothetical protein
MLQQVARGMPSRNNAGGLHHDLGEQVDQKRLIGLGTPVDIGSTLFPRLRSEKEVLLRRTANR